MVPVLALGGRDRDPAITWQGRTLSYRELARLVDDIPDPPTRVFETASPDVFDVIAPTADAHPGHRPSFPAGTGPVGVLVAAFAAAGRGFAVVVGGSAGIPEPGGPRTRGDHADLRDLPAGTWLVAHTSGTSGRPRAVCRSAASWSDSFAPLSGLTGLTRRDTVLLTGPLTATLHLFAAVHTLAIGAHLTDQPAGATAVHAVPARLSSLLDELPTTAPLRTAVVAGAPLPDEVAARCRDRGIRVIEYYGAAELSFVAARAVPGALLPFPGVEVRLDQNGLLWARSPYLALGYAGVTGPWRRDEDGFATVGDLADRGPDGALTIRGRGDAAINTGGTTVLAEDVEAILSTFPGVAAAAVVGRDHPRFGQIVVAVLEPGPGADLATVPAFARTRLAGRMRPRRYLVCDRLPRTAGGKIARAEVASRLADGSLPVRRLN
jgi:acyl-CoA synthetase (AMP-forming)/AMP-acid ligase II